MNQFRVIFGKDFSINRFTERTNHWSSIHFQGDYDQFLYTAWAFGKSIHKTAVKSGHIISCK